MAEDEVVAQMTSGQAISLASHMPQFHLVLEDMDHPVSSVPVVSSEFLCACQSFPMSLLCAHFILIASCQRNIFGTRGLLLNGGAGMCTVK